MYPHLASHHNPYDSETMHVTQNSYFSQSTVNNNDHQVENVHLNELWNAIADETSTLRMEVLFFHLALFFFFFKFIVISVCFM